MKKGAPPAISARKRPRQRRSAQLVEDILEAAVRVLVRDGGDGFTTVRVAAEAGVSVGSLYQYFPNREALLFRMQADEWKETWGVVEEVLGDAHRAPLDRLRLAVLTFFRSERREAPLRMALDEAGAPFRTSPEADALVDRATGRVRALLDEAIPKASASQRSFAADFLLVSMGAIAEEITDQRRSRVEVDAWAHATAEMYCGYLESLNHAAR
jgi:AcrR family transcriptional regulator